MTAYTTHGPVRGGCGHRHTMREAIECRAIDVRACESLPGGNSYSDRRVCRLVDGKPMPLTDADLAERDAIQSALNEGS